MSLEVCNHVTPEQAAWLWKNAVNNQLRCVECGDVTLIDGRLLVVHSAPKNRYDPERDN